MNQPIIQLGKWNGFYKHRKIPGTTIILNQDKQSGTQKHTTLKTRK